ELISLIDFRTNTKESVFGENIGELDFVPLSERELISLIDFRTNTKESVFGENIGELDFVPFLCVNSVFGKNILMMPQFNCIRF
ncbi:MAG: hypothetical protein ACI8R6_000278, partial [Candidatus Paceibacteria bacterium]